MSAEEGSLVIKISKSTEEDFGAVNILFLTCSYHIDCRDVDIVSYTNGGQTPNSDF